MQIKLKPCPFCGCDLAVMQVYDPKMYGALGCAVECPRCKARTGYFGITETLKGKLGAVTERSIAKGRREAARAWNRRSLGRLALETAIKEDSGCI